MDPNRITAKQARQMAIDVAAMLGEPVPPRAITRLAADLLVARAPSVACPKCGAMVELELATTGGDESVVGGVEYYPAAFVCECGWKCSEKEFYGDVD